MAYVPPWKRFETWVAKFLGGKRYWANSGEKVDVKTPAFTVQCKHVREMSLAELTRLATRALEEGRAVPEKRSGPKIGLVAVKLSGQRGNVRAPALFILHEDAFGDLLHRIPSEELDVRRD